MSAKESNDNRIARTDMSNSYLTLGQERNFIFKRVIGARAYLGGGSGGSNPPPPPPEIFRFFLKSEGKEVGRKREKKNEKRWGRGLIQLNC